MTRAFAKDIVADILDRQDAKHASPRFVVIKHRQPQPGRQDPAYAFSLRREAMRFAETRFGGDAAILAITDRGTIDITPSVVKA